MSDDINTENPELEALFERFRESPKSHVFAPLADGCRKAGMLEEAIEICEKGVSANPTYASGFVVRGKCYYDLGNADQAEASFEKVLELDPNNLVALKYLGSILAERGQPNDARARFEQILTLDPDDTDVSARLEELADAACDEGASLGGELEEELLDVLGDESSESGDAEPVELREVEDEQFVGSEITLGDGEQTPDVLATTTLADIYAAQGYRKKAVKIYKELLETAPGNRAVCEKLRALGVEVEPETGSQSAPAASGGNARDPRAPQPAAHFKRWLENLKR